MPTASSSGDAGGQVILDGPLETRNRLEHCEVFGKRRVVGNRDLVAAANHSRIGLVERVDLLGGGDERVRRGHRELVRVRTSSTRRAGWAVPNRAAGTARPKSFLTAVRDQPLRDHLGSLLLSLVDLSTFPVMAGRQAGRSQRPRKNMVLAVDEPRRSRFDASISTAEIGIRAETRKTGAHELARARREGDLLDELRKNRGPDRGARLAVEPASCE